MPVERYLVGTGLTQRDRRRIIFSNPPTDEERVAAKGAFKNLSFDRAVEEAEAWAIEVLKDAGLLLFVASRGCVGTLGPGHG